MPQLKQSVTDLELLYILPASMIRRSQVRGLKSITVFGGVLLNQNTESVHKKGCLFVASIILAVIFRTVLATENRSPYQERTLS